jgi:NADH-quinone oxidoreductase subunit C
MVGVGESMTVMKDPKAMLTAAFGNAIENSEEFRGELTIIVTAERIAEICQFCRDEPSLQYNYLSDLSGIDYYPQEPRFGINYHLYSMRYNRRLRLKTLWSDGDPDMPSVSGLWPNANWFEREVYDLFGVPFAGHPDLRRILMPHDWEGHPLRKDYPLGYETVQFSFNYDEVNKHKPFAKK